MGKGPNMPKCADQRPACFARTESGKCYCLSDTKFDGKCPFYKPEDQVKNLIRARNYKEAKNE